MSIVFNGRAFAKAKEEVLTKFIRESGRPIRVKTFLFREDEGSMLYTRLKQQAAERVGISYEPIEHSINDDVDQVSQEIHEASQDPQIQGVMVQKPAATVFGAAFPVEWWERLVGTIDPAKDVDCLTSYNLQLIKSGNARVLPATVKAVLSILEHAKEELHVSPETWKQKKVAVVGRSDIVGKPLYWQLQKIHDDVQLFGRNNLPNSLTNFDVVISAVGKPNLISGDQLKEGSIVIDVGAPKGDIEFDSASQRTAFITPVPGGVGPVTVVSLMENVFVLTQQS